MTNQNVDIESGWYQELKEEFNKDYFVNLREFINIERQSHRIFPPGKRIFAAFNLTPFEKTKVVILGQDPYHGEGQANGLSFSVGDGIKQPPSLVNIFKEISKELGYALPQNGNLEPWAQQGVLLLNAVLTVRESTPGSHQGKGWEIFTNKVIQTLSEKRQNLVFMLWGNYAKAKKELIDSKKHLVLEASHPSPLARGAFFGCNHFIKANEYLEQHGLKSIQWKLE
jgi:uracil-DNA glycosylase